MTLSGKKSSVILSINTHLAPPTLTRHRCHHCTNKHVFASSKRKTQFTPTITAEGFKSEARARLCFYDCIRRAGSSESVLRCGFCCFCSRTGFDCKSVCVEMSTIKECESNRCGVYSANSLCIVPGQLHFLLMLDTKGPTQTETR